MIEHEESDFEPAHHAKNPKRDPLAGPLWVDFDWPLLHRLLGEELEEPDREKLARALHEVLLWVLVKGGTVDTIARRAVALAWTVNPALVDGASTKELAAWLGCPQSRIGELTGKARRHFRIQNAAQRRRRGRPRKALK